MCVYRPRVEHLTLFSQWAIAAVWSFSERNLCKQSIHLGEFSSSGSGDPGNEMLFNAVLHDTGHGHLYISGVSVEQGE